MGEAHASGPLAGELIAGRYRVVRLIGVGGMGKIYEVEHLRLRRSFAMKQLDHEYARLPDALARFQREADAVARLRHPHIVAVTDWETLDDGSPCIIMEYLEGRDLADRIARSGPLPWPFIGRIADQILSALSAAHRCGVVHRDLKPSNVFIVDHGGDEWWVKLLDFGLSKVRDAGQFQTTTGDQMFGTPAYMAPEQARGRGAEIGPAADVWSMGVVLHQMATARLPFRGDSPMATLYQICHEPPEALRPHRPDAPEAFVQLIERALQRDVSRRITGVDALRAGLRAALAGVALGVFTEPLSTVEVTRTDVAIQVADAGEPTIPRRAAAPRPPSTPVPVLTPYRSVPVRALLIAAAVVAVALIVWAVTRSDDALSGGGAAGDAVGDAGAAVSPAADAGAPVAPPDASPASADAAIEPAVDAPRRNAKQRKRKARRHKRRPPTPPPPLRP